MSKYGLSYNEGYDDGFATGQEEMAFIVLSLVSEKMTNVFQTEEFFTKMMWKDIDEYREDFDINIKTAFVWKTMSDIFDREGRVITYAIRERLKNNIRKKYEKLFRVYDEWKSEKIKKDFSEN